MFPLFCFGNAVAQEEGALKGRVTDVTGRPVAGAVLSLYYDTNMRRRPDFMSPATDREGSCKVVLPSGKYWVAARLKKAEGYGPLMPGDKHSGDLAEVDIVSGKEIDMVFIVADLKETMMIKTKAREGAVKISGRIIDENGSPVKGACAVANRTEKVSGIPEYVSAWVDAEGRYTLYLPRGKFHIGSAVEFPPERTSFMNGQIAVDADRSDFDIVRDSPENR